MVFWANGAFSTFDLNPLNTGSTKTTCSMNYCAI
jgi:hypothetical protein